MKRFHVSKNLFDKNDSDILIGYEISSSGIIESSDWFVSGYIPVEYGVTYYKNYNNGGRLLLYDSTKTEIDSGIFYSNNSYTVINNNVKYIRINNTISALNSYMINDISASEPYEPYGNEWQTKSPPKYGTATETIQSGDTIYANGQPITIYNIKGNEEHTGTPSPSNPVMPNGVGNKTANLFNKNGTDTNNGYVADNYLRPYDGNVGSGSSNHIISEYIDISAYSQLTLSGIGTSSATANSFYDENKSLLSYFLVDEVPKTVNVPQNAKYIRLTVYKPRLDEEMFNGGSTALPYEPWGYKIPILTNQGSAYIYLNEPLYKIGDTADTINSDGTVTRRIGKVVLDGTENQWIIYEVPAAPPTYPYVLYQIYTNNALSLGGVQYTSCYSEIAPYGLTSQTRQNGDLGVYLVTSGNEVAFQMEAAKSSFPDVTAWTTYLSQNPVTVYYIKATPTTEQITLPSIPTTEGANSITVDTAVQPSEFSATWTGWHDASVKEYDGTDWQ